MPRATKRLPYLTNLDTVSKTASIKSLELLAPAKDIATAYAAISHGADAVYIGGPSFGARAAAGNSIEDISRLSKDAHRFGVRVYVTLNTIIYDNELESVRRMAYDLWKAGVDALIIQDMALTRLDIPPIDLHASTQTDMRSPEKIAWMAKTGVSQIVVPREFSLHEIEAAAKATPGIDIEVFVHGALCVSYSGDCQAGWVLSGRSANRGECPQICRLKFTLTDGAGRPLTELPDGGSPTRHWLSLADMCRLDRLESLIAAGATSFKIEGRLKPVSYVKNVTAAYSKALDEIIAKSDGQLQRASFGKIRTTFSPSPEKAFNRGFTSYFLSPRDSTGITSWNTPKWAGIPIATLVESRNNRLRIKTAKPIANGDGLGFFTPDGTFNGFRVNRSEGEYIYPAPGSTVPDKPGTMLFRNSDVAWEALMARNDTAIRTIDIDMCLRGLPDGRIAIDVSDERGCRITIASQDRFNDIARTPQFAHRQNILGRLGETIYTLRYLDDRANNILVPAKALSELRRKAIDALDRAWSIKYRRRTRRPSTLPAETFAGLTTTYHDNIANRVAEQFYRQYGATVAGKAVETDTPTGEIRIMATRYCLRRELGACLKTAHADRLPRHLCLNAPAGRLKLYFDCENCNMHVIANTAKHSK